MLAKALDMARDPVFGILPDARFFFVNEAACRVLGYSREDLLGLSVGDLDPNYPLERWPAHWEEVRRAGSMVIESAHRRKDGSLLPVEISITLVASGEVERLFAYARDTSSRLAAETSLRESEARYRTLFGSMAEGVLVQDAQGRVLSANPAAERILGIPRGVMQGHTPQELRWRATRADGTDCPLEDYPPLAALRTGRPCLGVVMGLRRAGEDQHRWALVSSIPQFLEGPGSPTQVLTTITDISERKRAQDELEQAERRLRALVHNFPAVIFQLDPEGRFLLSEGQGLQRLGLKPGQVVGLSALEVYAGHPTVVDQLRRALAGQACQARTEVDGQLFDNLMTPVFDAQGRLESVIGIAADITDQQRAEEARRLSEAKFEQAFQSSPDAININRLEDGVYLEVNEGFVRTTGWSREEAIGRTSLDLGIWADPQERIALTERLKVHGEARDVEMAFTRKDGSHGTGLMSARVIASGGERWILSITRDITDRKKVEQALREGEAKLAEAQRIAHVGHWERDLAATVATWSEEACRIFGLPADTRTVGLEEFFLRIHPEDRDRVKASISQAIRAGGDLDFQYRILRADGSLGRVHSRGRVERDAEGQAVRTFGTMLDVTDRALAEEALRQSEESYRGLFDSVGEAIYIQDRSGRFLDVNRGATEMYGYAREELIGQTPAMVSAPGLNDIPFVMGCVERAFAGEPQAFEFWGQRKNGEAFPKEVRLYPGTYFGQEVIIAMSTDVTDRRRAEEAQRQAQKLESLGILAGGIAHDFNNLLTAIMGNLNLAQSQVGEHSPARPYMDKVEATVLKAADLSRQMLAYSGKGHFVIKPRDLNAIVQEMAGLLAASLPKKIRLELHLAPRLPVFKADGAQIQQVVMNLITNASEAIGSGEGRIAVTTYHADLDREVLTAGFPGQPLEAGSYLVLSVSDSGCGMSAEVRSRIFDPFFTTKASGRGLGLSAMLGILKGHKAGIRIHSEPGRGSTFEVFFPTLETGESAEDLPASPKGRRMSGTLLLVDDEEGILDSTGPALEALGFRVVKAQDGFQALERFHQLGQELAVVFMDLSMPRMDGISAFLAMRAARPEVPVLLTSGYDQKEATEDLVSRGLAGFVQKPYRIQDLARELDRVLEGRSVL